MMHSLTGFLLCGLFIVTGTLQAETHYLDATNGLDSHVGTQASPWRSLGKAFASAKSGDTVLLNSGNYGEFTENASSERSDWLTFKAMENAVPIFTQLKIRYSNSTVADAYEFGTGIPHAPRQSH